MWLYCEHFQLQDKNSGCGFGSGSVSSCLAPASYRDDSSSILRLQVADVVISLCIASANDAPPLLVKLLQEGPASTMTCPGEEALQGYES